MPRRPITPTREEGPPLATVEECEHALHGLAARLADRDGSEHRHALDRSLSCTLRDLGVTFTGRLHDGELADINQLDAGEKADAQIKLTMSSDDLLKLVAGELHLASAWAKGHVKVDASIRDVLRLRSIFS